jgi:hypothetical protein
MQAAIYISLTIGIILSIICISALIAFLANNYRIIIKFVYSLKVLDNTIS